MSDTTSSPFDSNDEIAPNDPFAPATVDDAIAAYQAASAPQAPQDHSARLILALAAVHELPPEAQDALERVRQRVLLPPTDPATSNAGLDNLPRTREVAPPATFPPSRPAPISTRTPSRVRRIFSTLAAVLVVALLAGGYFALVAGPGRLAHTGHSGSTPSASRLPTSWSLVSSPNQGTGSVLQSVAAVSASDVWAVGWYGVAGYTQALTEHWNGTRWSIVPSPNVGNSTQGNFLFSVAAVSASDVWAVGYYVPTPYPNPVIENTLIEHWDGTRWSIVPSPNVSGSTQSNQLRSVAAVSASDVWAVGYYTSADGYEQTLIEYWNGRNWSIVPSPNVGDPDQSNEMESVAAVSASDVWAVGSYTDPNGRYNQTLIEHWDGTRWNVVPSPDVGASTGTNFLSSVAAVSASDVWAVGWYGVATNPYNQTLVERWDGTRWSIVPSPDPGGTTQTNALSSVAAVSASDVWAVGYFVDPSSRYTQTLTEQWDGTHWNVVPSPNAVNTTQANYLSGVAAVSASDVWAVGYLYQPHNTTQAPVLIQTQTEHYGYVTDSHP